VAWTFWVSVERCQFGIQSRPATPGKALALLYEPPGPPSQLESFQFSTPVANDFKAPKSSHSQWIPRSPPTGQSPKRLDPVSNCPIQKLHIARADRWNPDRA